MNYFNSKQETVAFVADQLETLGKGSVLTMTIVQDTSGVYSARIVTDVLSEDIGETLEHSFLRPHTNT